MIYLRVGLYAEGPADYHFLSPLTQRLLHEVAVSLPSLPQIDDTVGIDARAPAPASRAERIAAAVDEYWGYCNVFVVYADGAGDYERAIVERVAPGIERSCNIHADLVHAACVPVRETESWMLCDGGVFQELLQRKAEAELPDDPEAVFDPKALMKSILRDLGADLRKMPDYHTFFGENVQFLRLRRLASFRRFEEDLTRAVLRLAPPGGSSGT